ncbi:DUF1446 domain-containing protein [Aeromicrobium halocynthiae]|uniref:DUF1446 domain-containing protein n=1 Tax=Aeromicrobium halocynthiae TaxID=560557 RepID=A0ABN2VYH5_9ACTN
MTVRIGNCSGYYGDRPTAFREMLEGGELDFLTGDYLAELTMLILGKDRMKDPATGYAKTFVRQMHDAMGLAKERGVRVVTNAGGLNPAGLADRLREIASEQGLDLRVAHVEGDDLRERAEELGFGQVVTANAYLGAFGIAAALDAGADVVVTGRVTDASVVMGPAIHAHGWGRDDLDALAGALVAGHVIECGTQATGGNFSGFRDLDLTRPLGFPIAEVDADGSSVISKHAGSGGAVTVDTVTAQLVYEIQGTDYLNPDVVAHLDTVELAPDGQDRVRISGVRGSAPPATTKVCLNLLGGFRNGVEVLLTGLDVEPKAAWVRRQVEQALQSDPPGELVWTLDRTDVFDPPSQAAATSVLRCTAKSGRPEPVGRAFSDAFVNIALASIPGFTLTAPPGRGEPFGVYRPAYVPQDEVPHVVVHADGRREEIPAPSSTVESSDVEPVATWTVPDLGPTESRPLGELVHARSGDKGGDANVGIWVAADHPARDDAVDWLGATVDPDWVRDRLPEAAALDVDVHPLPNLGGVNVVIRGLLGEGVSSSTRLDPQAKALGEWLRARVVPAPTVLLTPRSHLSEPEPLESSS